jgi:hypothetical protein
MTLFLVALLGWLFGTCAEPGPVWSASPAAPLVTLDIRYELPAAGEVFLFWGVNGWHPVDEQIRPAGTVIRDRMMSSPMARKEGTFSVTIRVETGSTIDYGFLITKTSGGAPLEHWDGHESYRLTATRSDVVDVTSLKVYQRAPVVMDRAGAMLALLIVMTFIGLVAAAGLFLWLQPKAGPSHTHAVHADAGFAAIVTLSALLLGLMIILQHEMWRDELQAWRIATSSRTLSELFQNARYEGHPPIWYLGLYAISRLSDAPVAMQLFHLVIGTGSILLLSLYAPFTRWQKTCLVFGYFLFYEYLIISRNYALGVLALCAFCAVQARWPGRTLISAVLLALMINTSAFGAIIAFALGGWLVTDYLSRRPERWTASVLTVAVALAIGVAVAGMQSAPPSDNSPRMLTWNTALLGKSLEKSIGGVWKSYVPLPSGFPHFWNTNVLDEMPFVRVGPIVLEGRDVEALLSLALLGVTALLFRRTPWIMLLYISATAGILVFLHMKVNHGVRHTGHIFLVFMGCLWLSGLRAPPQGARIMRGVRAMLITSLFAVHAAAGGLAGAADMVYPFSASKQTAEFIQQHGLAETTMVGSGYAMAAAVAGYLNRPIYYAENKQTGTFIRWREKRTRVTPADVVRIAEEQSRTHHGDVLLVLTYPLADAARDTRSIASFERSIVREERYWLYLARYRDDTTVSEVIDEEARLTH